MGVGGEKADEPQGAEDVGDGEQGLGHQGGVPHLPAVPGRTSAVLGGGGAGGSRNILRNSRMTRGYIQGDDEASDEGRSDPGSKLSICSLSCRHL